jgi:hypothetical protein
MPNEQHPETEQPTAEDLRARVEEIATEADIDTSDNSESTEELLARVRHELQEEFERISDHYSDLDAELDEIETILADHDGDDGDAAEGLSEGKEADKSSPTTDR